MIVAVFEFNKMHGLENHFAIFDVTQDPFQPTLEQIQRWCSVNTGIGAEQIVTVSAIQSESADYVMTIYNPDGQIAEACGNATRCVAKLLMDTHQLSELRLQIGQRIIACVAVGELIKVDMGPISFAWQDVPLRSPVACFHPDYETYAVNVGNPHVVVCVDNMTQSDMVSIGQEIQQHPALINSANVGFMEIVGSDRIKLQVYERPGVLTRACGSGSCAAAAVARKQGLIDDAPTTVMMPGGELIIDISEANHVTMTGSATYCYQGIIKE